MKQKISFVPLDADLQLWLLEKLLKEPPQSPYTAEFLQGVRNLICGQTSSLLLGIPEQKGVVEQGLSENIVVGELEISPKNRKVILQGKEISLTPKEFDILYFLVENRGEVFTKEQIYKAVWEEDYLMDDSNIMAFIRKLRKKIEPNPDSPQYILTIWGIGYKFTDQL